MNLSPEQQKQLDGLMEMVKQILQKRDSGAILAPLERIVLAATQNNPDRIPTGTFFSDSIANHYGRNAGCW